MDFKTLCYDNFGFLGEKLAKALPWLSRGLELSASKTHPEIYCSVLSFIGLTLAVPSSFSALLLLLNLCGFGLPPVLREFAIALSLLPPPLLAVFLASPLTAILLGSFIPALNSKSRLYGFRLELPYVASYLAVMVLSGLSLYDGLRRLRRSSVFRNTSLYVTRLESLSLTSGLNPVFVLEKFANALNVREFKELILGYSSTLRTGGDVASYVHRKAEMLLNDMLSRVKTVAERLGLLMEACISVVCIGGIGLYLMFVASMSMSDILGVAMPPEAFFLYSFVGIPGLCGLFIYLADSSQISYPENVSKRYIVFAAGVPFIALTTIGAVLPYVFNAPPVQLFSPLVASVEGVAETLFGNRGFTPAIILSIALMVSTLPAALYELFESRRSSGYHVGLTNFLRDLVEVRKSGLIPEKCLVQLSKRRYGGFNKILSRISRGIGWGLPLRRIYEELCRDVRSWLISVNLFLLIDTLEVGGGSVEMLESMAKFSESFIQVEVEKRRLLRPLLLVPYMAAVVLILVSLSFLSFINEMLKIAGTSLPMVSLVKVLMTPLPLQMFALGLTAGKIASGRVSGGFIHALLLTAALLLAFLAYPSFNLGKLMGV